MLNKKRKRQSCMCNCDKKCKINIKRKSSIELVNIISKKYKNYQKNYILCDINFILLYGLL